MNGDDDSAWVSVGRYLFGQVTDADSEKVHLKLDDEVDTLVVGTPEEGLHEVRGRRRERTFFASAGGIALSDRCLAEHPVNLLHGLSAAHSDETLDRFAAKGMKALADVPDAGLSGCGNFAAARFIGASLGIRTEALYLQKLLICVENALMNPSRHR